MHSGERVVSSGHCGQLPAPQPLLVPVLPSMHFCGVSSLRHPPSLGLRVRASWLRLSLTVPMSFGLAKRMLTIALQSSDEARNFIERTQPRREPPMSMEDPRSDIGHCPQTALWDETVKRNVRHGKRDRRRVAEERAHARETARESICNQSYFSLTCADKSEQATGPRTNNNTAAAHAASVLDVVHQCGARESCLWSPPASAHFALAF